MRLGFGTRLSRTGKYRNQHFVAFIILIRWQGGEEIHRNCLMLYVGHIRLLYDYRRNSLIITKCFETLRANNDEGYRSSSIHW